MNLSLFESDAPNYETACFPAPRAFQLTAHEKLREGLRAKHLKQLLVAPTGSGKTYLGLRVINEALRKGRRGLFVCDRTALINQTSDRADSYGLKDHGIVQADHWRRNNRLPFQIASIQTIQARGYWPPADVIVIDEAHTQYKATREMLATTQAAVVGLTATPCSRGLGLSYTNMVNAATMHELTECGVLVPMRILSCVKPDMAGAETSGGEWTAKAAAEREAQIIGDVVGEWQTNNAHLKTIAFGADIAYCKDLAQRFNGAGVRAEVFTSETPDDEREQLLREYRKTDSVIRILISVEALAKGFDVPDVGCVIDARPMRKSLSTVIQMLGRGARSAPGKTEFTLQDHSGNILRFYSDFVDVYFNGFQSLDTAEKFDKTIRKDEDYTPTGCPTCGHKPFLRRCMRCGHEKESRSLVDESAGVMREIRIGKQVAASSKQDLWNQICTYARVYVRSEKKVGWALHKFKAIAGEDRPKGWSFESAPDVQISRATLGKLKSLRIAYYKARSAA